MDSGQAYLEAISHGSYSEHVRGLRGKYDHIRIQWEDFITGFYLRPHLEDMVREKRKNGNGGLRIYDLGCGTGDGYELISGLPDKTKLSRFDNRLIPDDLLEHYKGVDINIELLKEGKNLFGHYDHVDFYKGDFSCGLPLKADEPPFDLYFTSYGTLSHCTDEELVRLFVDIASHAQNGSLIMGDFIGRYSFEWQNLWRHSTEQQPFIDYKINYLYSEEERDNIEVSSFPLRLMTPAEVSAAVSKAAAEAGVELEILRFFDRSLFVGRHIETGTYNNYPQPMRLMTSSLFERGLRTYFPDLRVEYAPREGFDEQNQIYQDLAHCWNRLVDYTMQLMEHYDQGREMLLPETPPTQFIPLAKAYQVMRQTVAGSSGLYGDIRADLIESQLGYALRSLEMGLQQGSGLGHGLVAIIKVVKSTGL